MTVTFINPAGRKNQADLTSEQVAKLRGLEGYTVLEKTKPRVFDFTSSACLACE